MSEPNTAMTKAARNALAPDQSAGPSSPSPAELAAEALRDFLGQDWCAGAETRLQALVRSVEERTLREAAKRRCWLCDENAPMPPRDPLEKVREAEWRGDVKRWLHFVTLGNDYGVWRDCIASLEWSRLASLKETRER